MAQFRSKIHKKIDQVMAANMPKTLRMAVNLARCAEDDMNDQKAQEDELNKRQGEMAQTMFKNHSDTRTNQTKEKTTKITTARRRMVPTTGTITIKAKTTEMMDTAEIMGHPQEGRPRSRETARCRWR